VERVRDHAFWTLQILEGKLQMLAATPILVLPMKLVHLLVLEKEKRANLMATVRTAIPLAMF
jgi:hypothetical protein